MAFRKAWKNDRRAAWKRSHPWVRYVEWARRRCACKDPNKWWPFYGAKDIRVTLTGKQLEEIWVRDKAADLKKPSLDRINPAYDYANWNVRFIEFNKNARMAWDSTARDGYEEVAPTFI